MSTVQTSPDIAQAAHATRWKTLTERRWFVAAVYLTLTVLALYPIFSVTVPPLVDYPNHLARMHILATWDSDPALQKNYVVNWLLHPNMAMDLIVPLLAKVMPIYMAGKIFVAMTLLSVLGGTLALRRVVTGRIDLWPVLTFLFLYNLVFFWGFLNYLFTAGLALFAFAGWIALRDRPAWQRVALFSAVSFVLYAGHLFGLFVYGLMVAGYEFWRMKRQDTVRRWLAAGSVAASQFLLPLALFVSWTAGNTGQTEAINRYGSIINKSAALTSPVSFGMPYIDLPALAFVAFVLLACRSSGSVGFRTELRFSCALLVVVAVAMPNYLMGVWGTDLRLPIVVACVIVAGMRFDRGSEKIMARIVSIAVVFAIVRLVSISSSWQDTDRKIDELRTAFSGLPAGSKLMAVLDSADLPAGKVRGYLKSFQHMPSLAVIERSVFLPTIFTGHTSVDAAEIHRDINTAVGNPVSRTMLKVDMDPANARYPLGHHYSRYFRSYWVGWPNNFDYLLAIRFGNDENPAPNRLGRVSEGSFFDLYRVFKDEDGIPPQPGGDGASAGRS